MQIDGLIGVRPIGPVGDCGAHTNFQVYTAAPDGSQQIIIDIPFHTGDSKMNANGVTDKVLLFIIANRLAAQQSGEGACSERHYAHHKILRALESLNQLDERIDLEKKRAAKLKEEQAKDQQRAKNKAAKTNKTPVGKT